MTDLTVFPEIGEEIVRAEGLRKTFTLSRKQQKIEKTGAAENGIDAEDEKPRNKHRNNQPRVVKETVKLFFHERKQLHISSPLTLL